MKKYFKIILFTVILLGLLFLSFRYLSKEIALSSMALLISVLAIFQEEIRKIILSPILNVEMVEIPTYTTDKNTIAKYFDLKVKNVGFSTANNIKIKVRSENGKEWLILYRPFFSNTKELYLTKLTPNEEEYFNFGRIYSDREIFDITCNIKAYNQKLELQKNEKQIYYLEIVSDNTNPQKIKVEVNNLGFDNNDMVKIVK